MKNNMHAITHLAPQINRSLLYNDLKEARKYFSYILHDNYNYSKQQAQREASNIDIAEPFIVGDSTYIITPVIDVR